MRFLLSSDLIHRPHFFAEPSMDALSEALRSMRITGALFFRPRGTGADKHEYRLADCEGSRCASTSVV